MAWRTFGYRNPLLAMHKTSMTNRTPASLPREQVAPLLLVIVSGLGIVIFHLVNAWSGFAQYRGHHMGTALVYAREGIDLLRPVIVGFNANNAPTPQEFPIWQAAASLPLRWFGEWFGWANIVSLLFFSTALYPIWKLGSKLGGAAVGWWTLALLLSQPLVWIYAGTAATDGTCLAAAIWFFYCGHMALENRRRLHWAAVTAIAGALVATLKLPFMMAAGLGLAIVLVAKHRHDRGAWLVLGGVAAVAVLTFLLWTRYTDACIAKAEFGFVDLRISHNPEMMQWFFGDWSYRLNPANWIKGGWRALNGLFGSFALVAIPIAAIGLRRGNLPALAWLAGCFAVTAIFSHLVLHHSHYYLMYGPPLALLMAPVVHDGWNFLEKSWRWPRVTLLASLIAVALACVVQGLLGLEALLADPYQGKIAESLREHTSAQDKLLIVEGGWGGEMLFLTDRQGLSIWTPAMLDQGDNLRRLRDLGYSKLVMISESPLLHAAQVTNPGNAGYQRRTYEQVLTERVRSWPTVYEDEDILIKDVPR